MKLKVSKGELIISNGLEMGDDYLPGGVGATPPLPLLGLKYLQGPSYILANFLKFMKFLSAIQKNFKKNDTSIESTNKELLDS